MINDLLDIALDLHRKLRSNTDLDVLALHVNSENQRYIGINVVGGAESLGVVADALGLDRASWPLTEVFHTGSAQVSLLEDFRLDGLDLLRITARRPMTAAEIEAHAEGAVPPVGPVA